MSAESSWAHHLIELRKRINQCRDGVVSPSASIRERGLSSVEPIRPLLGMGDREGRGRRLANNSEPVLNLL